MKKFITAAFLVLVSAAAFAAQVQIPPIARVVDTSGTLTQAQLSTLTARGNDLEKATGTVLVTLMVPTTGSETIDDFAMRTAETWHPGKAGIDRAAVLVIAKNDKKWAIKTTRNTGVTLTDVRTKVTLNKMGAYLKEHKGDFAGAISTFYTEVEPFIKADTLSPPVTPVQAAKQDSSWSTFLWIFGTLGVALSALMLGLWWKVQRERAEAARLRLEREAEYQRLKEQNQREIDRQQRQAAANNIAGVYPSNPWPRTSYKQPISNSQPTKKRVVERARDTVVVPVVTTVPSYSSRSDDDDSYSRRSSSYSSSDSYGSSSSWDSSSSSSSSSSFDGGGSSSSFD